MFFLQPLSFVGRIPFSSHFIEEESQHLLWSSTMPGKKSSQEYREKQGNKQNQKDNALLLVMLRCVEASILELSLADLDNVSPVKC